MIDRDAARRGVIVRHLIISSKFKTEGRLLQLSTVRCQGNSGLGGGVTTRDNCGHGGGVRPWLE
jgi:hypothetical protein